MKEKKFFSVHFPSKPAFIVYEPLSSISKFFFFHLLFFLNSNRTYAELIQILSLILIKYIYNFRI